MDPISFDFVELEEILPALQRCAVHTRGSPAVRANHHLAPLRELAKGLGASECARQNMEYLGRGSGDLAIFLMEPSDIEADVSYHAGDNYCETVKLLDQSLRFAFRGQRNVKNTIVLDVRPFRSKRICISEDREKRKANNAEAYEAIKEALARLRPKVVVVCQCDDGTDEDGIRQYIENEMPEYLCSSVSASGQAASLQLPDGHKCIKVSSFHPMYFARTEEGSPVQRVTREYLFDASLVVAANALVGRRVSGVGIANLRECALHGPAWHAGPEGVTISYQWISAKDINPDALIRLLKQLGISFLSKVSTGYYQEFSKLCQANIVAGTEQSAGQAPRPLPKHNGTKSCSRAEGRFSREAGCA